VSEESLQRGPVSAFGRLRRGKAALFSGPFKLRAGRWLHFGWSVGTLSAGPKVILEIPAEMVWEYTRLLEMPSYIDPPGRRGLGYPAIRLRLRRVPQCPCSSDCWTRDDILGTCDYRTLD
jgi:hypothetical protein